MYPLTIFTTQLLKALASHYYSDTGNTDNKQLYKNIHMCGGIERGDSAEALDPQEWAFWRF